MFLLMCSFKPRKVKSGSYTDLEFINRGINGTFPKSPIKAKLQNKTSKSSSQQERQLSYPKHTLKLK